MAPQNRLLLRALPSLDDLLRDTIGRRYYPDLILPCVLLRRLECMLADTREAVNLAHASGADREQLICLAGYSFYNTSPFDFPRLCAEPGNLNVHFQAYLEGWSPNIQELLRSFDFRDRIGQLDEGNVLRLLLQRFADLNLHPSYCSSDEVSNLFEELLRRCFGSTWYPGEYFTPPEVATLLVRLLTESDESFAAPVGAVNVYDPCCGSGRLLMAFQDYLRRVSPEYRTDLYGQELNQGSAALCKIDLYMRGHTEAEVSRIAVGSTLSHDQHIDRVFPFMLANPPYGQSWERDQARVKAEVALSEQGRFAAGAPTIKDGQMLFLQHLLAHMRPAAQGGSRIAVLTSGSPLFNGAAGSGESEIRRWIIERDYLEAVIALPEHLFYNTGITTYAWLLSNVKEVRRRGVIQFIDAREQWASMRRNLGEKRRELTDEHCSQIVALLRAFQENDQSKIRNATAFGHRRVTIERPLRRCYQITAERCASLCALPQVVELLQPSIRRNHWQASPHTILEAFLKLLPETVYMSQSAFLADIEQIARALGLSLSARFRATLLSTFGERDETADICLDETGNPEADPELRDTEFVPLSESVTSFFEREVQPYVPDAWVNTRVRDSKDGQVGIVGYEINVTRLFHRFQPLRSLEEITADILRLEAESAKLLRDILTSPDERRPDGETQPECEDLYPKNEPL